MNNSCTLAIVSHDAGAANHIIAWIKQAGHVGLRVYVKGPALTLWKRAFPHVYIYDDIQAALANSSMLISGTGWASNVEYDAIKMARQRGLRSIAVIDNWANYRERFIRDEVEYLPDEIWVTDEYAKKQVQSIFAGLKVVQMPNLFLEALVNEVHELEFAKEKCTIKNLLYVLEPIRDAWGANVIGGEFAGLDFFIENLSAIGVGDDIVIRLRPHPSEPTGKYDQWIVSQKSMKIALDETTTLAESIAWSDIVVGCQTYAMVVALAAGKKVISSIPTWAPPCVLPQTGIIKLSDLLPKKFHNANAIT